MKLRAPFILYIATKDHKRYSQVLILITITFQCLMQKFEKQEEEEITEMGETEEWEEWMGFEGGIPSAVHTSSF